MKNKKYMSLKEMIEYIKWNFRGVVENGRYHNLFN